MMLPRSRNLLKGLFHLLTNQVKNPRSEEEVLSDLKDVPGVRDHFHEDWKVFGTQDDSTINKRLAVIKANEDAKKVKRESTAGSEDEAKNEQPSSKAKKPRRAKPSPTDILDRIDAALKIRLADFHKFLAAFGISDIYTFLSIVSFLEDDIRPLMIEGKLRTKIEYEHDSEEESKPYRLAIDKDLWRQLKQTNNLQSHPVLQELVVMPPESVTSGKEHFGHESIFVIKGKVTFTIFVHKRPKKHKLVTGDSLSFNSMATHFCENEDKEEQAEFVVSRTMMAADCGVIHG